MALAFRRATGILTATSVFIFLCGDLARAQINTSGKSETENESSTVIVCLVNNGDRVSGSKAAIYADTIMIETEYAGPITIPQSALTSCTSSDPLLNAQIRKGALFNKPPAEATVDSPSGDSAKEIENSKDKGDPVTSKASPKIPVEETWKRTFTFNYAFAHGNSNVTDVSLAGGLERKDENGRLIINGLLKRGKRDGYDFAKLFTTMFRYERKVDSHILSLKGLSYFTEIGYEQDGLKKLSHRIAWNAGLQTLLHKTEANELALDLGGGVTREVYSAGSNRTLGAGLLRLSYDQAVFKRARINQQFAVFPDFAEPGRYRVHAEALFRAPITKILSLQLGMLNRFDSRPQVVIKRNDFSVFSGFSVEF